MYFSFRGEIYKQKFGAAMGSPYSAIIANIFMEWLEQTTLATAPAECIYKLWKRYMNDILEIFPEGTTQQLTDHLNTVDPTQSIKLTHEEEIDGIIPVLDTSITRGKNTARLNYKFIKKDPHRPVFEFCLTAPFTPKLSVVRTLFGQKRVDRN